MAKRLAFIGLFFIAFLFVACGGDPQPATPPPAPGPGGPGPVAGLGGNLEDQSPGTPLMQMPNYQEALAAMANNLNGLGVANIAAIAVIDYVVTQGNPNSTFQRLTGNAPPPPQNGIQTYRIEGGGGYGDLSLVLYANYDVPRYFTLVSQVTRYGLNLYTTDQVALFVSRDNGYELLKVAYRTPNPPMQWYTLESQEGYYGGGYQFYLRATQRMVTTSFQNPQQGQGQPPRR